jgi:O-antigen ligase
MSPLSINKGSNIKTSTILWVFMYLIFFTAPLFPGRGAFGFYMVEWSFFFWAAILIYLSVLIVLMKGTIIPIKDPIFIVVGIFFLIVIFSIIDSPNKLRSVLYAGQFIPYFFLMYLAIAIFDNEQKLSRIIDAMTFLILIFSLIIIGAAIAIGSRWELDDFLLNTFNIGILKMMSFMELPFSILVFRMLNDKLTPFNFLVFLSVSTATILSGSRGTYVIWALIVFLALLKSKQLKKKILVSIFAIVIIFVGILSSDYVRERLNLMVVTSEQDYKEKITAFSRVYTAIVAWDTMIAHPFNGVGMGNLSSFIEDVIKHSKSIPAPILEYWESSHLYETQTTPLKLGAELGFSGFFFFFIFYYYLLSRVRKAMKSSSPIYSHKMKNILQGAKIAIIAGFVHNFFDVSFYNYYSWFYYGIIIAATRIVSTNNRYASTTSSKRLLSGEQSG